MQRASVPLGWITQGLQGNTRAKDKKKRILKVLLIQFQCFTSMCVFRMLINSPEIRNVHPFTSFTFTIYCFTKTYRNSNWPLVMSQ